MLEEAFNGDMSFAASLEAFGGGLDDLLGVSIGGMQSGFEKNIMHTPINTDFPPTV